MMSIQEALDVIQSGTPMSKLEWNNQPLGGGIKVKNFKSGSDTYTLIRVYVNNLLVKVGLKHVSANETNYYMKVFP